MERPNTVSGLKDKRARIAGKIMRLQAELNGLLIDLDHVDHTIRLFDPDADLSAIKAKSIPVRHEAYKGEMSRFVMGCLRSAGKPLTSLEIAQDVMKARGIEQTHENTVMMRKRVTACLSKLKNKGAAKLSLGADGSEWAAEY